MARCARDGLRQHAPLPVEDAGRKVAGLTGAGRERRSHQHQRLLFNNGDESVPHHLASYEVGSAHEFLLVDPLGGQYQMVAPVDPGVEPGRDDGCCLVLDDRSAGPAKQSPGFRLGPHETLRSRASRRQDPGPVRAGSRRLRSWGGVEQRGCGGGTTVETFTRHVKTSATMPGMTLVYSDR